MAAAINADNGVISGSAGLKNIGDSSGVLALQTNGTTAVTVDTSQNVTVATKVTAPKYIYTSGSLGTAVAGTTEYDGNSLYFTPAGTQRGIVPGMQIFVLNSGLAVNVTSTTPLPWLGVGCTLSSNTVYAFDAVYSTSATGTSTHSLTTGFGGTATLNAINYLYSSAKDTGFNQTNDTTYTTYVQTAGFSSPAATNTGNIAYMRRMTGIVSVATGGTFIPQVSQSTTTAYTYTTAAGSYFLIYPIGPAGSNVSVGTWA